MQWARDSVRPMQLLRPDQSNVLTHRTLITMGDMTLMWLAPNEQPSLPSYVLTYRSRPRNPIQWLTLERPNAMHADPTRARCAAYSTARSLTSARSCSRRSGTREAEPASHRIDAITHDRPASRPPRPPPPPRLSRTEQCRACSRRAATCSHGPSRCRACVPCAESPAPLCR